MLEEMPAAAAEVFSRDFWIAVRRDLVSKHVDAEVDLHMQGATLHAAGVPVGDIHNMVSPGYITWDAFVAPRLGQFMFGT